MRSRNLLVIAAAALLLAFTVGCSQQRAGTAAAKDNVEKALKQSGIEHVNIDEDRDKGVITLKGDVPSEDLKMRAQQVAQQVAPGRVIANELAVRPVGLEHEAKKIESNVDDGIEHNLKAAITAHRWDNQHIRFDVKNGVVTLKGDVDTPAQRAEVEKVAANIPGVQQVVNELEVKGMKRS
jgi:hyperosmotically inducible periplasmic protein